ncbi:MAG: ketoacyl-ACP synthase III [Bacteroidota bacterium]
MSIEHIALEGIATAVPRNTVSNYEVAVLPEKERRLFVRTTGIEFRRVAPPGLTAADLCRAAAERLLNELGWPREEIDALVFVSQTPDYLIPGSATQLQQQLGLPSSCLALDINQGCAGYVYGLATLSSLMSAGHLRKTLLLVGDTITHLLSPEDKSTQPIFSDAGSATALQFQPDAAPLHFNLQADGQGYRSIIVPEGGARQPWQADGEALRDHAPGVRRSDRHMGMEGLAIFHFASREVAPNVNALLDFARTTTEQVDHFVFHQANRLLNETIRKKLGLPPEKVPYSLPHFGNTSCATIPVTLVDQLRDQLRTATNKLVLSGFGVGLSWGSALLDCGPITCPEIIEL